MISAVSLGLFAVDFFRIEDAIAHDFDLEQCGVSLKVVPDATGPLSYAFDGSPGAL